MKKLHRKKCFSSLDFIIMYVAVLLLIRTNTTFAYTSILALKMVLIKLVRKLLWFVCNFGLILYMCKFWSGKTLANGLI